MPRCLFPLAASRHAALALLAMATLSIPLTTAFAQAREGKTLSEALAAWRAAGFPGRDSTEGDALFRGAVSEGRPDIVETLLAGGPVQRKMLAIPKGGNRVPLKIVRTFRTFKATLEEEMFSSMQGQDGWLARRLTANRIEVWTSTHGWLFDSAGRLLHEARPRRKDGIGREWYGAFLPNGRWITTDLGEMDGNLYFHSAKGQLERTLTCEELARKDQNHVSLLGWARSDKTGAGWVVNVGSEEGRATVWIGPTGPARVLTGFERWQLCYPRALGPRGTWWHMRMPDDKALHFIERSEAGHGPYVGYPSYSFSRPAPDDADNDVTDASCVVPHGEAVFGYWPGSQMSFIGSEGNNLQDLEDFREKPIPKASELEPSGFRSRKIHYYLGDESPHVIIDKSWLFDANGKLRAWIRGRKIGDTADSKSLLFRLTADSRIVTLGPDLEVRAIRRLTWKDNSTADALILWDDLRLGLFVRNERLVMARW